MTIRASFVLALGVASAMAFAPQSAQAEDSFELRLVHNFSSTHYLARQAIDPWVQEVEARSEGRIRITVYPASQLGKEQSHLLHYGLADFALLVPSSEPSRMPLSSAIELPIDLGSSCEAAARIWDAIGDDKPLYQLELGPLGLRPLYAFALPPYVLQTSERRVDRLEDMKGLKIRANGGALSKSMRAMDVIAVQIGPSEIYDALTRGTIDGAYLPLNSTQTYSLETEIKYLIEGIDLGSSADYFVAREETWQRLPADLQQILLEAGQNTQKSLCHWFEQNEADTRRVLTQERGIEAIQISEPEALRIQDRVSGVTEEWVQQMERQGRNGRAVLDSLRGGSPAM